MYANDSTLRNGDESDDEIEHFDDIGSLEDANEAAFKLGMAIRVQPPAPKATTFYFTENDDWKRQLAGHKTSTSVRVEHVRAVVKSAIKENDQAGGGGVKAVDASTVETCPDPSNDLDDYVDLDAVVPTYRIQFREAHSDQADGSMTFNAPKTFVMDAIEFGDGYLAGIDDDGRDIFISANKRINVRQPDEDGAYRFLGYFRGFEEVAK